jgi:circadian clock protein KaiC
MKKIGENEQTATNQTELFPGSATLVEGTIPPSSLLLLGPSGIGKTIFCKQFLLNGIKNEEPCIIVATDEPPHEIRKSMDIFGSKLNEHATKTALKIVDCYSWKLATPSSGEHAVSNLGDLIAVSAAIEKAMQGLKNVRLVLDSITGMTSVANHNTLYFSKFLQVIAAKIKAVNGNAIFIVAPEAHEPQFISNLRQTFDGTLEMRQDESGKEIRRLLRVFSLKGVKHKTCWTPFEITSKGIKLEDDVESRCVMCSRRIQQEPHIETIEGKNYFFDKADCGITYKKLKSLYGECFE